MELILIKSHKHLGVFEKEWSAILEENKNTNPFIEFEFVYNWWRFIGENKEIEIYAIKENNRMIAFFPLQSEKRWFGYMLHFLAFGDANYMDIIAKKRDMDRSIMFLFDAIINRKKSAVFCLHGLLESVSTPHKLSNYLKARNIKERYYQTVTPYIDLQNLSYDDYMQSRKKLHGSDRRERKLRRLGDVRLQISPATKMNQLFKVHQKRWERKNDTSEFSSDTKKAFFQFLAEQKQGKLDVRLTTLTFDDEIIAFTYGLSCRGRYLGYVLGHDSDFDDYGPGRILFKEKIKKSMEDGFHKLDMSIGYEPYKFEWNTDLDYTRKTIFSTNTVKARLYRNLMWSKAAFLSRIKQNYSFVLFCRNTIGKFKYYKRNKEKLKLWKMIWNNRLKSFVFERKRYVIAKLTNSNIQVKSPFETITPKIALSTKIERKDILQKNFQGYTGYYSLDKEQPFWVNENVMRLDDIQVITSLKRKSVYIKDWENEDFERVLSFVQSNYHPQQIFIHVNMGDKKSMKIFETYGFQVTERIHYSNVLGNKKLKREIVN